VIVDLHTHLGEHPAHISEAFQAEAQAAWGGELRLGRTPDEHYAETRGADRVVALGLCAPASGWVVPNDYVAAYVRRDPERLIGFGSVDPHDPNAPDELERMKSDLGLRGCKMGPIYQDADPLGPGFLRVCEALERLELPMLIHQGTTFVRAGPLVHARPILLDEVARRFPRLPIVIAHLGHPWIEEAVAVVRKHPRVYADISALHPRAWQLYQALLCALEYRTEQKLLFGSDYPFFTAEETMRGLRGVNGVVAGSGLPQIPEAVIEGIIQRPSLELLGIS
jgi:predicted TIM-barrel fold metal-dependent hydrolase